VRFLLLAAAVAVFSSADSAFAVTRVLALGDFGVGGTSELKQGAAMRRWERDHPARLVVTLGDNDYTQNPTDFHQNWVDAFGWLPSHGVRPAGALGNHDLDFGDGGRYEFDELDMPRPYYRRSLQHLDIFILNSNRVDRRQRQWLRDRLTASKAQWQVVAFHHPPYTCGLHTGNTNVQERWVPLFRRRGVDVVLSGHEHSYQRFASEGGVRYVVHGGGGASLYDLDASCPSSYPKRVKAVKQHGFLELVARTDSLLVKAISRSGRRVDRLVIR
jgi:hypothetical protein